MIDLIFLIFLPDSFKGVAPGGASKNMRVLEQVAGASEIQHTIFRPDHRKSKPAMLEVVQLVLYHLALDKRHPTSNYSFEASQRVAYARKLKIPPPPIFCFMWSLPIPFFIIDSLDTPLFKAKGQIHVQNVLHLANFFKYHLTEKGEAMEVFYDQLDAAKRPCEWDRELTGEVQRLGKNWKGTYGKQSNPP